MWGFGGAVIPLPAASLGKCPNEGSGSIWQLRRLNLFLLFLSLKTSEKLLPTFKPKKCLSIFPLKKYISLVILCKKIVTP